MAYIPKSDRRVRGLYPVKQSTALKQDSVTQHETTLGYKNQFVHTKSMTVLLGYIVASTAGLAD